MDAIVLLIKTSGFFGLAGIGLNTIYLVIALGLIALIVSAAMKRKIAFPVKPTRMDYALFVVMILQGLMLLVYFQKYPIFPEYFTQDPTVHVNYVPGFDLGITTSIPSGLLYFGVHYQLAAGVLLVGGEPLVVIQRIMAILVTISPLLFFYAAKKIFASERAALITTIIYSFSGMVWFAGVFDSGLYPNFYGILAALFLIITVINLVENTKSILPWAVFVIALINAYMSHYSLLTLLPSLILLPLLRLIKTRSPAYPSFRRYLDCGSHYNSSCRRTAAVLSTSRQPHSFPGYKWRWSSGSFNFSFKRIFFLPIFGLSGGGDGKRCCSNSVVDSARLFCVQDYHL